MSPLTRSVGLLARLSAYGSMCCFTGHRRGDAYRLGRQHVPKGTATRRPRRAAPSFRRRVLPELQQTLGAGPGGDLTFVPMPTVNLKDRSETLSLWSSPVQREFVGVAVGSRKRPYDG